MSHNIIVESGKAFRLLTSGKYCDQDIIITAEGGKEDLDAVLTEQDGLIDELREVLKSKGSGEAELVIEPLEVTENGTYVVPAGVDGYSPVTVNVPVPDGYIVPTGTATITENGTHDVAEFASVEVNVESGGGGGELNLSNCQVIVQRPSGASVYYGREMAYTDGTVHFLLDSSTSGSETRLTTRCDSVMYVLGSNFKSATYSAGEVLYTNSKGAVIKTPATAGTTVTLTIT